MKIASSKTNINEEESPPKQEQKRDILGAVKDKVTTGINKVKDNLTLKKNKKDSDSKKSDRKSVESNSTPDKEAKPKDNIEAKPSYQEIMEQRRQETGSISDPGSLRKLCLPVVVKLYHEVFEIWVLARGALHP